MASLHRRSSGLYLLSFRYQGRQFQRSLETTDADQAALTKKNVEQRLQLLTNGTLELSDGAAPDDLWAILLQGRVRQVPAKLIRQISLAGAAKQYLDSYSRGSKEAETLKTERVHLNNFERILGTATPLHTVSIENIQQFISIRLSEKGNRGGTIKPDTVRKELQTFRLLWSFARHRNYVFAGCPVDGVRRPKRQVKAPFQTWEQITAETARCGLADNEGALLWSGLFLRESEIGAFLEHVRQVSRPVARFPYIYPALCFCAYTGARRSEMFRARVGDVADQWVTIREKKRDRDAAISYRLVPLSRELEPIINQWLEIHPGGEFLFCKNNRQPLDDRTAREAFAAVTTSSKWSVLRGYHILRHSFASNLARSGRVSQAEIDEFMGHQTEEMRLRYRHLFPEDKRRAVEILSYKLG